MLDGECSEVGVSDLMCRREPEILVGNPRSRTCPDRRNRCLAGPGRFPLLRGESVARHEPAER